MRMARNIAGVGALGGLFLLGACGDPIPPAAQAGISIHLQEYENTDPVHGMDKCPPSRHWVNVPTQRDKDATHQTQQTDANETRMTAINNQDGNAVSCSVKPSGSGFRVSGNATGYAEFSGMKLNPSTVHIVIGQIKPGDNNATGQLTIQDHASINPYSSEECTFSVSGGSMDVKAGGIWASVHCEGLAYPSSPGSACLVDNGYFVFENCAQ